MKKGHRIGYVRVSTLDQNTERQLDGLKLDKVFTDKASGRDTKRPQLAAALEYVREGDTLLVAETNVGYSKANRFVEQGRKLESQHQRLVALSPESVLTRGYSITRDAASGAILRSAAEAAVQQKVTIQLGSGKLAGRVEEVSP